MLNFDNGGIDIDIKIIGIGSGGCNALGAMKRTGISDVSFLAVNTDAQDLNKIDVESKLAIGAKRTGGLGTGGNPDKGLLAVEEDRGRIVEQLEGSDIVFLTAGLGGGTGTAACYKMAEMASACGALTVAVVTKPFLFEGKKRMAMAEKGLDLLLRHADTVIVVPNQRLMEIAHAKASMLEAFQMANSVLYQAIRAMVDLINIPGRINVDFADIRTILTRSGLGTLGIGESNGDRKAEEAAFYAVSSPLIETPIEGARRLLVNITGSDDLSLYEVNKAAEFIRNKVHQDAEIIFGNVVDPDMGDSMKVTVVATDFPEEMRARMKAPEEKPSVAQMARENQLRVASGGTIAASGSHGTSATGYGSSSTVGSPASQGRPERNPDDLDIPTFLRK